VISDAKPRVQWESAFEAKGEPTAVHILMEFESLDGLETIISMSLNKGFTMGLSNLDVYIQEQFRLRG